MIQPFERRRRIVVGVDGSACANRAVEFAARLHVVSAYHEAPAAAGLVVPRSLIHESAEAIASDAIRLADDREPIAVRRIVIRNMNAREEQ